MDLSIDPKGFYLICFDKSKMVPSSPSLIMKIFSHFQEAECLDLALIHDTRTGGDVTLPNVN